MIHHGDLFDVLPTLDAESVDAVVTDPPYGIGFMGREWDTFKPGTGTTRKLMHPRERTAAKLVSDNPNVNGRHRSPALSPSQIDYDYTVKGLRAFQEWSEQWAREVLRVLKPGAYIVVCGAPRSYHRMACGLEDAGFGIRDCLSWNFGSGFPKSLNFGCKCRENAIPRLPSRTLDDRASGRGARCERCGGLTEACGVGTALKPCYEPILLARKPFKGTLAENFIRYGTGGLNIDACRIPSGPDHADKCASVVGIDSPRNAVCYGDYDGVRKDSYNQLGRWPANAIFDEAAAVMLDEQTGELGLSSGNETAGEAHPYGIYGSRQKQGRAQIGYLDRGGASRFFYCPKPDRSERDNGTEHLVARARDDSRKEGNPGGDNPRNRGLQLRGNFHPTVKPIDLMRWLVRLVTPPDGTVLDPFMGSGTTGIACRLEGREFIGIERERDYVEIAESRIGAVMPLFSSEATA